MDLRVLTIEGRIEFPKGVQRPRHLWIYATRRGVIAFFGATPAGEAVQVVRQDGTFRIYVDEGEPLDLQLEQPGEISLPDPRAEGAAREEALARAIEAIATEPNDCVVRRVGDFEAMALGVRPGDRNVVLRLVPRVARRVACRVIDLDGAPVADSKVTLRSLGDGIHGVSGPDGRVVFDDVSIREYEMTADVPTGRPESTVRARALATPGEAEIPLALRRGVAVRVRSLDPIGDAALLGVAREAQSLWTFRAWRPGADGVMQVFVEPDWTTLALTVWWDHPESGRVQRRAAPGGHELSCGRAPRSSLAAEH